jgi:hypothetical protein
VRAATGEQPAAEMPAPLPALGPAEVAILGVRDVAFREQLDVPSVAGQLYMRTADEVAAAPRDCAREAGR